LSSLKII